jgi:hypothetical protein
MTAIRCLVAGLIASTCLCLVPVSASAASTEQGVGVVAEYRPAAGRFSLMRMSPAERVPIRIGTLVMAGDQITLPAGASVVVHLADSTVRNFEGPGNLTIPDARPLGKFAAVFRSISMLFDDEHRLAGTAASRGGETCGGAGKTVEPIDAPILAGEARIVAGERDLPLAWRGGCEPFLVTVNSSSGTVVLRESVAGRQLRLDKVPLSVGRYTVAISDASGARFESALEAVSRGPMVPAELAEDNTPLGVIAQAVWMADQDGGRWRMESFERLRPLIRKGDRLAGAIGDGVLWGRWAAR